MVLNLKDYLYNYVRFKIWRKIKNSKGDIIQTIASYLRRCEATGSQIEKVEFKQQEEKKHLIEFITSQNLWLDKIEGVYITEGAEQKVFWLSDKQFVLKLNSGIFYKYWIDYFHSLLLHNYYFPETNYSLVGFHKENGILNACVKQPFVKTNEITNIEIVKSFMLSNGFSNSRFNDYINEDKGIIIEDLHDENVLTKDGVLFFVDTVFYVIDKFWEQQNIIKVD